MDPTPHLEIEDLRVGFHTYEGYQQVLELASLHVDHGETLGLVGESGCGKTVLALAMLRLLHTPPAEISAKRFLLAERDLLSIPERDMRRLRGRELAMIFQDPMSSLNPVFTVGSQMLNVIHSIGGEKGKSATARALEFISLVGLPDPEDMMRKYPHQLSGGQRQRVIIALALCCDARFIIADEPTRNLDVTVQAGILKTIAHLQRDLGVSLLFIANNLGLVSAMCSRVGILLEGRIVESGSIDEVIGDARHPYTHMLLRAVPTADERRATAAAVPTTYGTGRMPEAAARAEGACPYYSRCPEGVHCRGAGLPSLVRVAATHEVACHNVVARGAAL